VPELAPIALPLAANEPAGGAAIGQIVLATAMAAVAMGALALAVHRYRSHKGTLLARAVEGVERISGLPGWAALPSIVSGLALITALLGFYWDVSIHIDEGRDEGPLANPAHYLILGGLFGIFAAGYLSISIPRDGERPSRSAVKIMDGWYAPIGGLLVLACGAFALTGFPLDDLWHRVFGQDVTLWGPTHLVMVGGAALTTVAQAVLLAEGMRERDRNPRLASAGGSTPLFTAIRRIAIAGALLIGVSAFQAEFDFGVPQFRMVFQPLLIAFGAGFALVMARIWIGRGGALGAVAFYLLGRGLVSLLVGPVFGQTTPALPLYVVEALLIEGAALYFGRQRPLALGAAGGLLAGTAGFAAEWLWADLVMPRPWTGDIFPEALVCAIVAGIAGGVIGGLLAAALRAELPRPGVARPALVGSLLAFAAVCANGLWVSEPENMGANVRLEKSGSGTEREAIVTAQMQPPDIAADPAWFETLAWQGGGMELSEMEEVGPGTYRSAEPVPITGDWKAILRLQDDRTIAAVPIYAPADSAIPVEEIPARNHFEREFVPDKEILQRELKEGVPGFLWPAASLAVLAFALAFVALLSWGAARVARAAGRPPEDRGAERRPERPRPPIARPVGGFRV
jgi:hypothetical protein